MELELKHIAPYLPYRLRMENEAHKELLESKGQQYHPSFLNGITHEGHMFIGRRETSIHLSTKNWKPILRPMSDLIEDCIDGECPLNIIKERYNELNEDGIEIVEFHDIGGITLYGMLTEDSYEVSMPLWAYDMLFSWHFDVFGLIPAGVAVGRG